MALSKTRNYLLLNYCQSPVVVNTRYDSFLIPGGTDDEPGSLPFTIDEMSVINNKTKALRIGLLWPEKEYQEEIYEELRITNWRDILTDNAIRDIILHPTMEGMQKILDIDIDAYFERVRGIYIGLRNSGYDISNKVVSIMEARRQEFARNQRKSRIVLTPHHTEEKKGDSEIEAMKAQMDAMKKMLEQFMKSSNNMEPSDQAGVVKGDEKRRQPAKRTRPKQESE